MNFAVKFFYFVIGVKRVSVY